MMGVGRIIFDILTCQMEGAIAGANCNLGTSTYQNKKPYKNKKYMATGCGCLAGCLVGGG